MITSVSKALKLIKNFLDLGCQKCLVVVLFFVHPLPLELKLNGKTAAKFISKGQVTCSYIDVK